MVPATGATGAAKPRSKTLTGESTKVAIVAGASRGIGSAVAERLAADGFAVAVNYSGNPVPAEQVVHRIEGKGGRAPAAKADVSDAKAVRQMFDAADAAFGGVDVLVNNAGIMMLSTIADSDDALATDRDCGGNREAAVHGDDLAVRENDVSRLYLGSREHDRRRDTGQAQQNRDDWLPIHRAIDYARCVITGV